MGTIGLSQITLDDASNDPDPLSFDAPQRPAAPLTTRITCRVCDRKEDVPILSSGLLCGHCRADLDATERHIRETLAAAEARFQDALDTFGATYAQADPRDQERYHAVEAARAARLMGFAGKYKRALDKGDGLSVLLKAKEQCDETAREAQGKLYAWAYAALDEVEAAR